MRNSFQLWLRGSIRPVGGKTEVRVTVGLHPAVLGFVAVWLLFLGLFLVEIIVHLGQLTVNPTVPFAVIAGMAGFALALVQLGVRMDGGPEPLIEWLDGALGIPSADSRRHSVSQDHPRDTA